jgi:hypothetical protein
MVWLRVFTDVPTAVVSYSTDAFRAGRAYTDIDEQFQMLGTKGQRGMQTAIDAGPEATRVTSSRRSLWALTAVVGALLLAGIVVGIVAARGGTTSYAPSSPEGRVQRYLGLLQDGNVDQAYGMTDLGLTRSEFHSRFDGWSQQSHRVTLAHSYTHGTEAAVTVDVSTFSAGPFGSSDSSQRMTFTLTRNRTTWRIDGPTYLPY